MSLKKIAFFLVVIISFFVINSLIRSIDNLWQKKDLIVRVKQNLEKEKKENEELRRKLDIVKQPQFVEEEARNKLFLAKPGEGVIALPTDVLTASNSNNKKPRDTRPNWQKWWETFF